MPEADGLEVTAAAFGASPFSFELQVVRPDDLLVLRFGFVNLHPDPDGGAQLVRIEPAADALVVVAFQPQHVQEQAFNESSTQTDPLGPPPVVAVAARESRLAFRLPSDLAGLPLTLDALLDWSAWEPSLAANALPADPSPEQAAARPRPAEPGATHTAVELPYRLVLSPTAAGRWAHTVAPQTREDRVELWHTRLTALAADGSLEEDEAAGRPVRAIWTADWNDDSGLERPSSWPVGPLQSLEPYQRRAIVQVSGDFGLTVRTGLYPAGTAAARRLMLTALGGWLDVQGHWPVPDVVLPAGPAGQAGGSLELDPDVAIRVLEVGHVQDVVELAQPLEPAGAAAALFAPVEGVRERIDRIRLPPPPSLGEVGWVHRARGGRDEYVEFQQPGLLWPLGHLASLITITERRFEPGPSGAVGAYLRQRRFIRVTQPVRDYRRSAGGFPHAGRELPFTGVRFATLVTPDLEQPPGSPAETPPPFFPMVGANPYPFELLATDHENRPVQLTGPLLFVPFVIGRPIAESIAKASAVWDTNGPWHTATARSAPVAFAPLAPDDHAGLTTATCQAIEWQVATATAEGVPAGEAPVLPAMASATVSVPALAHLAGPAAAAATTSITFPPAYLDHGFGAGNPSHLYAAAAGIAAAAAAERSGGVAAPSFTVQALSKAFGPVGDAAGMAAGSFNPSKFLPTAKLFGALSLKDLILPDLTWPDPGDVYPPELRDLTPDELRAKLDDPSVRLRVPVLAHREVIEGGRPVAVETLYAWKPEIGDIDAGILKLQLQGGSELALSIAGRAPIGGGAPTSRIDGRLDRFALDFAGVITVSFERFAFSSTDGSRMDVHVQGVDVRFHGALEFVQTVQSILPSNGFADPPYLTVLPTGITAGFTLAIPTLGVGVVSIEAIALAAGVSLPFTGDPAGVRFAISSREHPFLVTVSLFGGGGFFAVAVNTSGPPQIEAAIEFGGNFSLDIGVASGNVHVMAGIYFKMLGSQVKLSGYLRLGGSVSVLGILTVSVEFYLALTYDGGSGKAYGEATLSVSVEIFGLSKSVSLHVERKFAGAAGDPTFAELIDPPAWDEYCAAFAPVPV